MSLLSYLFGGGGTDKDKQNKRNNYYDKQQQTASQTPEQERSCGRCGGRKQCQTCYGLREVGVGDNRSTCPDCRGGGLCQQCGGSGTW